MKEKSIGIFSNSTNTSKANASSGQCPPTKTEKSVMSADPAKMVKNKTAGGVATRQKPL